MEQPLIPGGACALCSINLSEYVLDPYTKMAIFDWESLIRDIPHIVKAMDDVIEYSINVHVHEKQRDMAKKYRNIGIGIMGLGSAFMKMGMKYGDKESIEFAERVIRTIFRETVFSSNKLAKERGIFPAYTKEVFDSEIIQEAFTSVEIELLKRNGLRNASLLSIAPTGSIGTMLGVTTGIEPPFRISYKRTTKSLHKDKDVVYDVHIKEAEEYMNVNNTDKLPDYFIGADQVDPYNRVKLQSVLQKYVDTAISSTVNLPKNTTTKTISDIYFNGWKNGLKGMTVFVDECKRLAILTTDDKKTDSVENHKQKIEPLDFPRGTIEEVPTGLEYRKYKLKTGCGTLYLFIGYDDANGKIYDIFTNTGGSGGCFVNTEANSRLISACLRGGVPVEYIIEQLNKTDACPSYQYKRGKGEKLSNGKSCPSAIANVLRDLLNEIREKDYEEYDFEEISKEKYSNIKNKETKYSKKEVCPECGNEIHFEGGCKCCSNCGWSKCN